MNTAIDFQYIENNTHEGFEMAVARAQKLFLDGWIVTLGLSGKDSGAASICLVEGLRRAKQQREDVGPLHVVTTNTTLENIVLHDYMLTLHDDLIAYGDAHGLPIECHEIKPSLSSQPIVEYVWRQTTKNPRNHFKR